MPGLLSFGGKPVTRLSQAEGPIDQHVSLVGRPNQKNGDFLVPSIFAANVPSTDVKETHYTVKLIAGKPF